MTKNQLNTENILNRELAKQLEKNGIKHLVHVKYILGDWAMKPLVSLAFNNMTLFDKSSHTLPNSFIRSLAETLKCHPTELLPQELLCSPSELKEFSEQNLESCEDKNLVVEETQTTQAIISGLKREMSSILATLNSREERVIRMRFGFDNKVEMSLQQIGNYFGKTQERIRQIEGKALRKMTHPTRSKKIRTFY